MLDVNRSVAIFAKIISERYKVRVIVGGNRAATDGKSLWLPNVNVETGADSEAIYKKLVRYTYHEAGHLRNTDFSIRVGPDGKGALLNIIEDIRIEREMGKEFPGARVELEELWREFIESGKYNLTWPGGNGSPSSLLTAFVLQCGRSRCVPQSVFDAVAEKTIARYTAVYGPERAKRLSAMVDEIHGLNSTAEAAKLRDRIMAEFADANEEVASTSADSSDTGDDSADSSDTGDGDADPSNTGDDSADPSNTGDGDADSSDTGDDSADPSNTGDGDWGEAEAEGLDVGQILRDQLEEVASKDPGDVLEAVTFEPGSEGNASSTAVTAISEDDCAAASQRLRTVLASALMAQRRVRRSHGWTGTRLALNRLASLSAEPMPRVFSTKRRRRQRNTFVGILVDRSYSMASIMSIAGQATLAMMMGMEPISGINTGCWAFPGSHASTVLRLTGPDETLRGTLHRYVPSANGGTPMLPALTAVGAEVLVQREQRKVVAVVTDGQPHNPEGTLERIRYLEARGIELIGVGIATDVSHLFKKSVAIQSVGDLANVLFREIGRELIAAA